MGEEETPRKIRLAYADDNALVRRNMKQLFAAEDQIEVVGTAGDGAAIMSIIKEKKPDVVLLDIVMPKLDGIEVAQRVKEDGNIRKKPLMIAVSAVGDAAVTQYAFQSGVDYYVMKPFDGKALRDRIYWLVEYENKEREQEKLRAQRVHITKEVKIAEMLMELGMPVHIMGQYYLRDAIIMVMEKREYVEAVTKLLYPDIARKNKATPDRVERAIRHAVEVVWTKGDVAALSELFKRPAGNVRERPTNTEFIAVITEYAKRALFDKE